MTADRDNRTEKPSVIDLVTDPETFDRWQRQREREEASGDRRPDADRKGGDRPSADPRDTPPDRRD